MTVYYPNGPSGQWDPIPKQTEGNYEDYNKIKGFEDVGYFLLPYVASGGEVSANVQRNDTVDASTIVVSLNNDIIARDGTSFKVKVKNAIYYLDFTKEGDWAFGTTHPAGTPDTDYLAIATVTTDINGNVDAITDSRGAVGGFRLKSDYGLFGYLNGVVNAKDYGVKGNGTTDDTSAIQKAIVDIGEDLATLVFPNGDYKITEDITFPANVSILFLNGAKLSSSSGTTITIHGSIQAQNQEIFVDNGTNIIELDDSPNEYNLGWFSSGSGYINERWNFAKRGMATFRTKIIRVPKPYEGQAGVFKSGDRLFWYFDDEIKIEDDQNASTWYIDAEFYAKGDCTNFINIEDTSKPENIYFYGALQALVDPDIVVDYGINVKSVARLTFFGNVVLNGFQTSIKLGGADQVAPVGDVRFLEVQCSFFYETAVLIYGKATPTVQNVTFDSLNVTAAQTTGLNAVEVKGKLRDINLFDVFYATDVAKGGYSANDAANVVYVESNSEGEILHCVIDGIYQANATNGVKITSTGTDQTKIQGMTIRRVHGKFNNSGINVDVCSGVAIYDEENTSNITVGSSADYTKIITGASTKTITDNGDFTTINGLGSQTRGSGVLPAANVDWPIGTLIRETSDGKVYLRYAKTGTAADDFVALN